MRRGIIPGVSLCIAAAVSIYFLYEKSPIPSGSPLEKSEQSLENNTPPVEPPLPSNTAIGKPQPVEDPDILIFARKIAASKISETDAISMLTKSSLSQNKKAVVLETYNEQGGLYADKRWGPLLLNLLTNSNDWPELANKASDSLAEVNKSGEMDSKILEELNALADDEIVKKSALAYSLAQEGAIESALGNASSDPELEILSRKHAALLDQNERLQHFETSTSEIARVQYLEKYIAASESRTELMIGVNKGTQESSITSKSRPGFILAASESAVEGKSIVLFEYWKKLLPQTKEQADFISILNLAIQKAAYSEKDKSHAESIMTWLADQSVFDPNNANDPRIDLSIAMANACAEDYVNKSLCPGLEGIRKTLAQKLKKEGFQSYLTGT